jgi:hypothetical protein
MTGRVCGVNGKTTLRGGWALYSCYDVGYNFLGGSQGVLTYL